MAGLQRLHLPRALVILVVFMTGCAGPMETQLDPARRAQDLAEACARSVCRTEAKPIRLRDIDGGEYEYQTQLFPYADGGSVSLFAGEAIVLDFAADGSTASEPHFVRVIDRVDLANIQGYGAASMNRMQPADPKQRQTVSLEFKQEEGKPDMTLVLRSDLDFTLKFDALIWVPTRSGIQVTRTSMCPLFAGIAGHELWPQPIVMIALANFRVLRPGDATVCN